MNKNKRKNRKRSRLVWKVKTEMIRVTEKYRTDCLDKAYRIATMFCGGTVRYDITSSERAGYPVYRNVAEYYTYFSDLNDRIEVMLQTGEVINIWLSYEIYNEE